MTAGQQDRDKSTRKPDIFGTAGMLYSVCLKSLMLCRKGHRRHMKEESEMKMRWMPTLIAGLLTLTMAGCGGTPAATTTATTAGTTAAGAAATTAAETTTAAPQELRKIVLAFPTWTGAPADLQMIQDKMNEISVEKINIEAQLLVTDFASYRQQMTLMLTGSEPLDIFVTIGGLYTPSIMNGQLVDLEQDDLLNTYGSGIIEAVGQEYIDACRVNGILYGLPNNREFAQGRGCASVRTDLLEEIGYPVNKDVEIEKISLDQLNDIYAQIKAKHPELEIYRPTTGSMIQFSNVDALGGNNYGVAENYGAELKVVNLFETSFYKDYCARMFDYFQKGYISKDAATDTTAVGELVKNGVLASYTTGGKPGIKAQETQLCGKPMTIFQTMDDYISSSAIAGFPWAIANNTADPSAAMTYLNLLYTDVDMMNLISWGVEGTHYKVQDDGLINFADGVDAKTSGYNHSMGWMFPNQLITHVWSGNNPDVWNNIRTFNTDAKKSAALGFTFDSTNVSTELTSVQNVYEEYQKVVEYGMVDPATAIAEMNAKMMDSGLDKIIAEKQTQLDAWAAKK